MRSAPRNCARSSARRPNATINNFLGPTEAPDNWWQVAYRNAENGAQAWLVIDPPDGKIPPLTPEAQQRQQAARRSAQARARAVRPTRTTDRSLYDRCITRGFPNSRMPTIYGNSSQIVQGPGYVAITYEMIHDTRVIPLDVAPHVGDEHPHPTSATRAAAGKATRSSSKRRTSSGAAPTATPMPSG